MKKRLRTWTLRITATALLIAGLLLIIVLYPVLTYAHKTPYKDYTIYHNAAIDPHLGQRLEETTALVKRSAYYDPALQTDLCLDDGSVYPALVRRLGGPAFARGFYNKVVLMAPANWKHNYAALNGYRWNAAQLLAHEMIHCYQFRKLGLLQSNPIAGIPEWKWEGYPEYIARQYPDQQDLAGNISRLLQTEQTEHNGWIQFADSTGTVLPYYKSWLLMQYCLDIKKMTYDQVLTDTTSQAIVQQQMMRWFALQSTPHTR